MLKIAWDAKYVLALPPGHRFPMSKYEVLPQQLLYEGTIHHNNLFSPFIKEEKVIFETHDPLYWGKLKTLSLTPQEMRRTGFPLTNELVEREFCIALGTIQCAEFALEYGIAMNIAGGTHHAFYARGEGFCLLNDMAMAANDLLNRSRAKKILIVDLDVHQGNGTAQLFAHDSRVFTFSMHGANNYPLKKEVSDLDIALPDYTDDKSYLALLNENLSRLIDRVCPDFIFYQAGVDVLATDKLGRLGLTPTGCRKRDEIVLRTAKANKIPIVVTMGGGYSPIFKDIIDAHANTYRLAQEIYF